MTAETVVSADGVPVTSWFATGEPGAKVVVLFHGNAGNIADRAFKARHFLDAGFGAVLAGYRGFGDNPGSPTENGLYADANAVLAALKERGIGAERVVLYGESMGSGVAVQIAAQAADSGNPVAGVILEAPFNLDGGRRGLSLFMAARTVFGEGSVRFPGKDHTDCHAASYRPRRQGPNSATRSWNQIVFSGQRAKTGALAERCRPCRHFRFRCCCTDG